MPPATPNPVNMIVMIGIMYLGSSITIDGEEFADRRAMLYLASALFNVVQLAVLAFSYLQIKKNKDSTLVHVPAQKTFGQQVGLAKTVTVEEYDRSKVMEALNQLVVAAAIVGFITYKWESHRPLLLNTLIGLSNFADSPLFKVYVLGKPAAGALKRPWTPPSMNPLAALSPQEPTAEGEAPEAAAGEIAAAANNETEGMARKEKKGGAKGKGNKGNTSNSKAAPKAAAAAAAKKDEDEEDVDEGQSSASEEPQQHHQSSSSSARPHHGEEEEAPENESEESAEMVEVEDADDTTPAHQQQQQEEDDTDAAAAAVAATKTSPAKRKSKRAE